MVQFSVAEDDTFYHNGNGDKLARMDKFARIRGGIENKPFIAWDGEGVNYSYLPEIIDMQLPDDILTDHRYVMLGCSSVGHPLVSEEGIKTEDALNYMLGIELLNPDAIHVAFSFSYDVEMILKDIPANTMRVLYRNGHMRWNKYEIEYHKGKWFQIKRGKTVIKIWDVWAFFSVSFVDAVKQYCENVPEETMAQLVSGKASRGSFTTQDIPSMAQYMRVELNLLVEMMDVLRARLYGAGLYISHWQGPGALASYSLKQHKMYENMTREEPPEMIERFCHAYAAGRFELFKIGWHHDTVYQYDIRSAYPNAIRRLPNLAGATWKAWEGEPFSYEDFAIFRVRFVHGGLFTGLPMPFFHRDQRNAVHFPNYVEGWFWAPEAYIATQVPGADIREGWVLEHDGTKPFEWVEEVYNTRAQWKREGNPSQLGLKLLLNSMYGKMAQRIGWERYDGPPQWHQLEWAGWVTSYTRSMLYDAMLRSHQKAGLLAVETDAVFSLVPLKLPIGEGIGEWEESRYDEIVYLQSGFYFKKQDGKWTAKYRGYDKGSVTLEETVATLAKWRPWENSIDSSITGTTTRFTTMGTWLGRGPEWRNLWATEPRILKLGQDGKRVHRNKFCEECRNEISPADALHQMVIHDPRGGESRAHILPWRSSERNLFREEMAK